MAKKHHVPKTLAPGTLLNVKHLEHTTGRKVNPPWPLRLHEK